MNGILYHIKLAKYFFREFRRVIRIKKMHFRMHHQHGLSVGRSVEIRSPQNLVLGNNVSLDSNALLHCGGFEWCNYKGKIQLGDNVYIGPNSVLFGAGDIVIGNNVLISPCVVITSHQHTFQEKGIPVRDQPTEFNAVTIEDDVWVGSNAVILPGVTIGKGAIIGAGAVVTQDIPQFSMAVGVPARVVKDIPR